MRKPLRVTNKVFEIPASFASEADEAAWWFANRERVGELIATHGRIVPGRKVERTRAISIRIPEADLELAQQRAKDKGIGYQSLLKDLIHKGLRKQLVPSS